MNIRHHIVLVLFLIFFLSGNVSNVLFGMHSYYWGVACFVYAIAVCLFFKQAYAKADWIALLIISGNVLTTCIRYVSGYDATLFTAITTSLPAIVVLILPKIPDNIIQNIGIKIVLRKFLQVFFLSECSMAILEFMMRQHIVGHIATTYQTGLVHYDESYFRSVALLGGPLLNALVVTTMTLFYLFDETLTQKKRLLLFIVGLSAVLCFNARVAIVINIAGFALWFLREIRRTQSSHKIYLGILIVSVALYVFYAAGTGSRLFATESISNDSSINVRLRLFKYILSNWRFSDILWGHSTSWIEHEMAVNIKVRIIENGWVRLIYIYGLLYAIYLMILYVKLCRQLLANYSRYATVVISLLFIVLSSANPDIVNSFVPMTCFLICIYTYQPLYIKIAEKSPNISYVAQNKVL